MWSVEKQYQTGHHGRSLMAGFWRWARQGVLVLVSRPHQRRRPPPGPDLGHCRLLLRKLRMASCYGSMTAPSGGVMLPYLPLRTRLPDGTPVEIDLFKESEYEAGRRLLNGVIEEGLSWPFEDTMDMEAFRAYFLSHAAFVVRAVTASPTPPSSPPAPADLPTAAAAGREASSTGGDGSGGGALDGNGTAGSTDTDGNGGDHPDAVVVEMRTPPSEIEDLGVTAAAAAAAADVLGGGENARASMKAVGDEEEEGVDVWGAFYIKPNFPGRCSHVCNGGFITDPRRRRRGVAKLMGHAFLRFAKDLGYKASYFNLVFRSNEASLALWRGLGFTELAVVPKAGRLKGIDGLVDAIQFHYDLDAFHPEDLPEDLRGSA